MLETVGRYGDAVIVVGLCSVPSRGPRKVRSGAVNANIPVRVNCRVNCCLVRHNATILVKRCVNPGRLAAFSVVVCIVYLKRCILHRVK